ncbi:MAG: ribbon-helix-helix protein, CopG family [Firmicutes bacterium]|nr:ribbon-helix-helix protein, CopG family [Bacillota bacterium]
MSEKFILTPKSMEKKEDKFVVMTLRIEKDLQEEFDKLASKSERSRNEVMCMALKYALEQLEFTTKSENSDKSV